MGSEEKLKKEPRRIAALINIVAAAANVGIILFILAREYHIKSLKDLGKITIMPQVSAAEKDNEAGVLVCHSCGAKLEEGDKFCPKCGAKTGVGA